MYGCTIVRRLLPMFCLATMSILAMAPQTTFAKGCQLINLGTLPITNSRFSPLTTGELDGHKTKVLIDTGSSESMVIMGAARRAGLDPVHSANTRLIGMNGEAAAYKLTVKLLKFGDVVIHNKTLIVAPTDMGDVGLVLGADVLSRTDVEFDLANHRVILWEPKDCEHVALAYWNPNYLLANLETHWLFGLNVKIDGRKIDAKFDSGTDITVLSTRVAKHLGFDASKSRQVGFLKGLTSKPLPYYRSTFKEFTLGPMAIKNPKLRVADLGRDSTYVQTGTRFLKRRDHIPDMYLGADFLRANRVYIANSQHLVYFTYNGGPVFDKER